MPKSKSSSSKPPAKAAAAKALNSTLNRTENKSRDGAKAPKRNRRSERRKAAQQKRPPSTSFRTSKHVFEALVAEKQHADSTLEAIYELMQKEIDEASLPSIETVTGWFDEKLRRDADEVKFKRAKECFDVIFENGHYSSIARMFQSMLKKEIKADKEIPDLPILEDWLVKKRRIPGYCVERIRSPSHSHKTDLTAARRCFDELIAEGHIGSTRVIILRLITSRIRKGHTLPQKMTVANWLGMVRREKKYTHKNYNMTLVDKLQLEKVIIENEGIKAPKPPLSLKERRAADKVNNRSSTMGVSGTKRSSKKEAPSSKKATLQKTLRSSAVSGTPEKDTKCSQVELSIPRKKRRSSALSSEPDVTRKHSPTVGESIPRKKRRSSSSSSDSGAGSKQLSKDAASSLTDSSASAAGTKSSPEEAVPIPRKERRSAVLPSDPDTRTKHSSKAEASIPRKKTPPSYSEWSDDSDVGTKRSPSSSAQKYSPQILDESDAEEEAKRSAKASSQKKHRKSASSDDNSEYDDHPPSSDETLDDPAVQNDEPSEEPTAPPDVTVSKKVINEDTAVKESPGQETTATTAVQETATEDDDEEMLRGLQRFYKEHGHTYVDDNTKLYEFAEKRRNAQWDGIIAADIYDALNAIAFEWEY